MSDVRPAIAIRALSRADLAQALIIQAANYPAFLCEDEAAFASRLAMAANYCLAVDRDGELIGYLLAHGWPREAPPPVGTVLDPGSASEILYIHDLAVAAAGQGEGLGRLLVDHAFALAAEDGLAAAELIAVEGAAAYWRALGFSETATTAALATKLASYGAEARWMTKPF